MRDSLLTPDRFIAHRGWQKRFPENTLLSVAGAIEAGARHIEIDIQLTADQVAVLHHDVSLQRMCQREGSLFDLRWQELQDISAHEPRRFAEQFLGARITALADCVALLAQHPHVHLYVEVKEESVQQFGADTVLRVLTPLLQPIAAQVTIISFDFDFLLVARRQQLAPLGAVLSSWQDWHSDKLLAMAPAIVFCSLRHIGEQEDLAAQPFPLAVYEIADIALARSLRARGAALIETFDVGAMIAQCT